MKKSKLPDPKPQTAGEIFAIRGSRIAGCLFSGKSAWLGTRPFHACGGLSLAQTFTVSFSAGLSSELVVGAAAPALQLPDVMKGIQRIAY